MNKINGKIFAEMFISGANNLYNNKSTVDELNVFPVPDGDTGTNMSLTAMAMANEIKNSEEELTLTKAADKMSFATLRGARGNSGVILSQFFRGISKCLKGKEECGGVEFAEALKKGSEAAYKAVMKPTEGTILTVSREAATGATLKANTSGDIKEIMTAAVERGDKALKNTTEMLPVLKQAGVVDAGGQGWMFVLHGVLSYLETGEITPKKGGDETVAVKTAQASVSTDDIKFKYCTEFIIEKYESGTSVDGFREAISDKGDCQLVIDDDDVCKVHIHTNHPGFVLEEAVKIGELINLKIDNMKHQHREIIKGSLDLSDTSVPSSVISDQAAKKQSKAVKDKKDKKEKKSKPDKTKQFGFVAVCAGKGLANILSDMGVDRVIEGGQTLNPSTEDILKAVKKVKANVIFVFPNNKNIIMAANQAAIICEDKKIIVIETKSFPQCVSAMVAFNELRDTEHNKKAMEKAIERVKTGQLTYAVRDTLIDGKIIEKDDTLGIVEGKIASVGKDRDDVLTRVVADIVDEDTEFITVYYGKDIKSQEAERMMHALEAKYEADEIEVSFKRGQQPLYYYIVSAE